MDELLTRSVANIIPGKSELEKTLSTGKKLNIYLGIDPTATRIHLGHAVPLRKLQEFAKRGHNVTFLIGDFTALIGDTSDKDSERPVLTKEQIAENFKTYKKQAEKILDFSAITVVYNSEWLKKLTFEEIVKLCQRFSVGDFISRELIRKRLDAGKRVALHEVLYPVMQGYDSYFLDTDLQIGGTDQTFNMQAGRTLQKELRGKESYVLTTEFLMGTDGRKMSKTWGNAIWLDDAPNDMYAKVMAISDDLIVQYFLLGTSAPMETVQKAEEKLQKGENPMKIKKELAEIIVTELHSKEEAQKAAETFEKVVQLKEEKVKLPYFSVASSLASNATISQMMTASEITTSISDAKRVINQGGTVVAGKKIDNPNEPFKNYIDLPEIPIQVGKRRGKTIIIINDDK